MFRKLLGFGLLVLLLTSLFGGLSGRRSQAAYYEGYAAGLQAKNNVEASVEGQETAVPPAAPYRDGFEHGRFWGWGAVGILGIFAIFFKIGFFFLLFMLAFRLLGSRRWRQHGPWKHHKHGHSWHGHHPGREKSPKWMDDDDDEPVMTV